VHLVGFIIRIFHDVRSPERQKSICLEVTEDQKRSKLERKNTGYIKITTGHCGWSEAVVQWLYLRGDMPWRYSGEW